jgi:hypothetical protein
MKRQKSCGPRLGKLVHQLPGVVTFAYDLRFRCVIACWKGIIEEIHFGGSNYSLSSCQLTMSPRLQHQDLQMIHMDVSGLLPIQTGSFWEFSSLVSFSLVFGSLTCETVLRP